MRMTVILALCLMASGCGQTQLSVEESKESRLTLVENCQAPAGVPCHWIYRDNVTSNYIVVFSASGSSAVVLPK